MKIHCRLPVRLDLTSYEVLLVDEKENVKGPQPVFVTDEASLVEVYLSQLLLLWEQNHVTFQLRVRARADGACGGFFEIRDWGPNGKTLVPLQLPSGTERIRLRFSRGPTQDQLCVKRAKTCPGQGLPWQLHFLLPLGEEVLVAWPENEPELLIKRVLSDRVKIRLTLAVLPVGFFSLEQTLALMRPQQREACCYWDSITVCSKELYRVDEAYFEGPGKCSAWKPLSLPGLIYIAIRISVSSFALRLDYQGQPPLGLSTWILEVWNPATKERHAAEWDLKSPSLLLPLGVAETGIGFELGLEQQDVFHLLMLPSLTAAQPPAPCTPFPQAPHRVLHQVPIMRQGCCVEVVDLKVIVRPLSGKGAYVLRLQQLDGKRRAQRPCTVKVQLDSEQELDTFWADLLMPVWIPVQDDRVGLKKTDILRLFHHQETWLRLFEE